MEVYEKVVVQTPDGMQHVVYGVTELHRPEELTDSYAEFKRIKMAEAICNSYGPGAEVVSAEYVPLVPKIPPYEDGSGKLFFKGVSIQHDEKGITFTPKLLIRCEVDTDPQNLTFEARSNIRNMLFHEFQNACAEHPQLYSVDEIPLSEYDSLRSKGLYSIRVLAK